jgi:hypothetical protein
MIIDGVLRRLESGLLLVLGSHWLVGAPDATSGAPAWSGRRNRIGSFPGVDDLC